MTPKPKPPRIERVVCLLDSGHYKPGDPPPKSNGYLECHEWAAVQIKAGLRQVVCGYCGLWKFPQELSKRVHVTPGIEYKTGQKVRIESPVCLDCDAKQNRVAAAARRGKK